MACILTGISRDDSTLNDNLLRLRAVLILIDAPRGSKLATARALAAELKANGRRPSLRSVQRWQERYLIYGFAGIARRSRSDRWDPSQLFGYPVNVIDCAARVLHSGDTRREYRRVKPSVCYETFRKWIRRVQAELRAPDVPKGGESLGLFF